MRAKHAFFRQLYLQVLLGIIAGIHVKEELFLVLAATSSDAALPTLIKKLEHAGCRSRLSVWSFRPGIPSISMAHASVSSFATMFIAQAMGIELSAGNQITLVAVSMLTSKGSAGVAGASFIALLATLTAFRQIPIEGAAIILGVDRFISEIRTATNMIGNGVATLVVARWEGERDDVRMHAALNQTSPVPRRKREGSFRGYRPVLPQASYAKLPRPVALPRECCFYEAFWRLGREHRPCALA